MRGGRRSGCDFRHRRKAGFRDPAFRLRQGGSEVIGRNTARLQRETLLGPRLLAASEDVDFAKPRSLQESSPLKWETVVIILPVDDRFWNRVLNELVNLIHGSR